MAVSRRLRYEILRRDNHACRYCGATAPDVKLTVDHVVPVALGGSDDPSNLVTACADCNAGKTSSSPDQPIVEDVQADALRWSRAMEEASQIARQRQLELDSYLVWFEDTWLNVFAEPYSFEYGSWTYPDNPDKKLEWAVAQDGKAQWAFETFEEAVAHLKKIAWIPELPSDWKGTVSAWFAAGMSRSELHHLMEVVAGKDHLNSDRKYRYFCGCVWGQVRQRQEIAQALLLKEESDS